MSAFAILRVRKRKGRTWAEMARHALREGRQVSNADPHRAAQNLLLRGEGTAAEVIAAVKAALPEKRRKDAVEVVELLVTASPEAMKARGEAAKGRYFVDALRWIGQKFGGMQNVHLAVVHRDESTPHMQVLVTPLVDGKLVANRLIGGPQGLRDMQTNFAREVGHLHGLVRGLEVKPGEARPRYQSIRRWYAAIAAAGSLDQLPPARQVPVVPPEPERPGVFAGKAARQEYERLAKEREKALAARKEAVEANRRRQERIGQLASVGLATYGREARRVGERLARAAAAEQKAAEAQAAVESRRADLVAIELAVASARDRLDRAESRLAEVERRSGVEHLRELRSELERDVQELRDEIDQLHRYRRDRYGG